LTVKGRVRQTWLANKIRELGAEQFHQQTPKGQWSTRAVHLEETAVRFEDAELLRVAQWVDLLWLFPEGKDGALRISPLGDDGRIRYHQFAFATHTGRSLGLGREALMQLSAWMRGLIQPQPGEVLLSADYAAQEIAVAAGLSGDPQLREAYLSGDPYVAVGEMAGLIRPGMSEGEIRQLRKLCKSLTLGRLYGMSLSTFRRRSGVSYGQAARVWQFFDRTFTKFSDGQARVIAQARRRGWITTKFGWKAQVVTTTSTTTLYNWAVQAGAGDVLKLAVIRVAQAGFDILTTCHDSLLVSIPDDRVEERCAVLRELMAEAGEIAVGIPIRVDVQVVRPGERLLTADTGPMWSKIMGLLGGT
jgi:DNA polymerase I